MPSLHLYHWYATFVSLKCEHRYLSDMEPISPPGFLAPIVILWMICVKNDRWFVLKWQIYIISVSHQNQNNGLPCCSTPRRISFLCFVLIQTSLHEGDAWYHFVVIFTCLLLTLYFICNSMAINLIWIELNWINSNQDRVKWYRYIALWYNLEIDKE